MASVDKQDGYAPFDLYPYNPAQPPAYAFLVLFGIVGILHVVALIPYRCIFPMPLAIGCGMEAAAYYFRSRSHHNIRQTLPFLIQNLLLLAAPPFLAASIYMSPRRIAQTLEGVHLLPAHRVASKLLIVIDVACFATQVTGAIMSGSETPSEAATGETVIIVGLVLQIVAFAGFVVYISVFHVRMRAAPKSLSRTRDLTWQPLIYGLYFISVLFVVRNVTRVVEYQQGGDGELLSDETYLYALDGMFMLGVGIVLLILHPGRLLRQARRLREDGDSMSGFPLQP